ncbi:hypothetical protein HanRHA438_Chr15g0711551 [Helianthus annuus]|nr:hypothetical protein HanRHA438_Chr15g0711551 [Helianthus annuus]
MFYFCLSSSKVEPIFTKLILTFNKPIFIQTHLTHTHPNFFLINPILIQTHPNL